MAAHQQLLYHIVFSTKERRPFLQDDSFREDVWAYMAGIAKNLGGFAIRIGGYHDHAHLLVRIPAKVAVSDFVGKLKANTSKHINESRGVGMKFHWQDGYGAFTVSPSQQDAVVAYIDRQVEHHRKQSFQEEFLQILKRHKVDYDSKYIWE
ncbi:IS200/IS605 family transposase [Fuerstiella marisgermanici]|uniref:Transposase n=1 Tax=Fuerstiella marisgermanici TaxID=1891926 RepID=A0A1P8WQY3_9PLAN|nr:IS200/IS605 family transposase [Fuerstiella marisgermanici]APZ96467.1 Transposase [Fuerstiella marisgermanici]